MKIEKIDFDAIDREVYYRFMDIVGCIIEFTMVTVFTSLMIISGQYQKYKKIDKSDGYLSMEVKTKRHNLIFYFDKPKCFIYYYKGKIK